MKYIDMFAGVGGFRIGVNQSNEAILDIKRDSEAWECVATYEKDKFAVKSYNAIFKESLEPTDVTKLSVDDVPEHDIICGGFPCQAFSVAGKRAGFDDPRGNLFFEIMRIARAKETPYLFLENVKGLISHQRGKTFYTILKTLNECGYDAQWEVLNSQGFGVAQKRQRVFIVANLRGKPRPKIFPFGRGNKSLDGIHRDHVNTITARYGEAQGTGTYVVESELTSQRVIQLNNPSFSTYRVYSPEGLSPALTLMQGGMRQPKILLGNRRVRKLTPRECWRLQGFPDWAFDNARQVNSETQLYKQIGNAVTVNVINAITNKWRGFVDE